ncbi:MAG: hypothetical protein U9R23_04505 [Candidatus Cloacimonadota bacterium]|nr:hypothetical protein [Candidatus Cloacimonadota bacterium]
MAIFTGVVAFFAVRQNKLNKTMLKLEAYPKRLQIYDAMQKFVGEIMVFGSSNYKKALELLRETRHAKFLFDKDDNIEGYIELFYKNAIDMVYQLKAINGELGKIEEKKRKEIIDKNAELLKWFQNQLNVIDQKFKKYLQL